MHLLYCDESGSTQDPNQTHFILAGLSVFERQGFWLANELDKIAARFNPADPSAVELHGSPMYGEKGLWRTFSKDLRLRALQDALQIFKESNPSNRIFLSAINKKSISPKDPVLVSFEQLSSRFDQYLMRLHKKDNTQRGLIIFDKSTYEGTIQNLATDFRTYGHTWGIIRNLAEVPLFLDSKASRLIQLADLIAYAALRKYSKNDDTLFSIVESRIDSAGGLQHGLFEKL